VVKTSVIGRRKAIAIAPSTEQNNEPVVQLLQLLWPTAHSSRVPEIQTRRSDCDQFVDSASLCNAHRRK
jgi:hypothetical protein